MRALVLGGAACVWDDLARAEALADFDTIAAVNDAGAHYPGRLDIWATLHPEHLERWKNERRANGHPDAGLVVAHIGTEHVDETSEYLWPGQASSGSSGLYAVKVLQERGADRIVLCGVPMTADGAHFFDTKVWHEYSGFLEAWQTMLPRLANVRSMSGWTKDLLGAPTQDWLA